MQKLKWAFIFLGAIFIQSTFMRLIAIHDICPDLLVIVLVFYALRFGQMKATIAGFTVGVIQDILSGGILGLSSFTKSIAGFLGGFASKKEKKESLKIFLLALGTVAIIHNILFFYLKYFGEEITSLELFIYFVLPGSLYTFIFGVLLYYILSMYHS